MTIEKLNEIVEQKDIGKIEKSLRELGFSDMAKDKYLKSVSIVPIIQNDDQIATEWIHDGKMHYQLFYIKNVKNFNNFDFIFFQVNKDIKEFIVPHHLKVYCREI